MILKKLLAAGSGRARPGFIEYSTPGNYTFTVPDGYNKITICMIGGGGGGAAIRVPTYNYNIYGGGGLAGTIINQIMNVQPKQQINITVGSGGTSNWRCDSCGNQKGNPGTATIVGELVAPGGAGGNFSSSDTVTYKGNHESRTVCTGIMYNGVSFTTTHTYYSSLTPTTITTKGYGGQAGLGNGGNATYGNTSPSPGLRGGGGGCGVSDNKNQLSSFGGKGGDGYVKISWGL